MVQNRISRFGLGVAVAAVAAVASACGQGASNAQPPASDAAATSASAPTSSATDSATSSATKESNSAAAHDAGGLCKAADLKLSLGHGDGAAGTYYSPLVFTNVSDHPCTIQGFPGVSYVGGSDGHQVGAAAERDGAKGPAINLKKGDSAFAVVGFSDIDHFDAADCQPQPVRGLRVYPPQETASMFVEMDTKGCSSDKIPGHQLTVKTLEKGTGE